MMSKNLLCENNFNIPAQKKEHPPRLLTGNINSDPRTHSTTDSVFSILEHLPLRHGNRKNWYSQ